MAERKRALEALDRVDKNKRLKMETLDLFLSNSVSSSRVARIAEAAVAAGVTDLQEVADRAKSSKPARNLRCMALKNTRWPRTYKTVLIGHGLASDEPKDCDVEILLPREIVYTMSLVQEPEELFAAQQEGVMARPDVRRQLRKVLPGQQALALSLWQDGAPFNNNREHSLEMWTMSALCMPDFRFPLVAWPKELQVKFETHDGIFKVLQWSFRALLEGRMPTHRHDGRPWDSTDAWRRRCSGKALPKAVLTELRGDWAMLKQVLDMPGWQDEHICFRCNIRRTQLHEVGMTANWRPFFWRMFYYIMFLNTM